MLTFEQKEAIIDQFSELKKTTGLIETYQLSL